MYQLNAHASVAVCNITMKHVIKSHNVDGCCMAIYLETAMEIPW